MMNGLACISADSPWKRLRHSASLCLELFFIAFMLLGCSKQQKAESPPEIPASQAAQMDVFQARQALQQGRLELADQMVLVLVTERPQDAEVLELAGDVQQSLNAHPKAYEYYQAALEVTKPASLSLYDKQGRLLMKMGRPFDALEVIEHAVTLYPNEANLHRDVAGLQISLGLVVRASEHLKWLAMRGYAQANELGVLVDLSRPQADEATIDYSLKSNPNDPRPRYGLATTSAYRGDWLEAAKHLKPIYQARPDFLEATALYGRAVIELNDSEAISQWSKALPADIHRQTQYWMAIGKMAEREQLKQAACRAYWEAVRLFPDYPEALSSLSSSLLDVGKTEESRIIADRVGKLARARDFSDAVRSRGFNSQRSIVQTALATEELGRLWEAAAWLRVGASITEDIDPQMIEHYNRIRANLTGKTPWLLASAQPALDMDLSSWPMLSLPQIEKMEQPSVKSEAQVNQFRFIDEAAARSLDHICKIHLPHGGESGMWIYQSGAGGAAALDFDLDGWMDTYLTMMDGTPLQEDSSPNQLYRNLAGSFVNVTDLSRTGDLGFAQGVTVSDYNSDGFDDIYIANIGRNRLYQNKGDGTFVDVTHRSGCRESIGRRRPYW